MEIDFWTAGEVARLILRTLFNEEAPAAVHRCSGTRPQTTSRHSSFTLHDFQKAAVHRARRIIDERGGVLVADSVGLGKTYIALALVEEELRGGGRILLVLPAALRAVWTPPLQQLKRRLQAGDHVQVVTHGKMSRGNYARAHERCDLVVVDEAHRFRNPATRRYQTLARVLRGSRAVLLTATPVNNDVSDLYHLLRLFLADDAVRDLGVPGLRGAFEAASNGDYREVRSVLGAVMIRRSRSILTPRSLPTLAYPSREATHRVRYHDPDLPHLARQVRDLELAPYRISSRRAARASTRSTDAAALVRLGLLKRLESSRAAFSRTVQAHLSFAEAFLNAAARGRLVKPRDPVVGHSGDGDPYQLLMVDLLIDPAPPEVDLEAVAASVRRDQCRLVRLLDVARRRAPKLEALVQLCRDVRSEGVLVFTEYRDTAEAIWQALGGQMPTGRIDGGGAWLGQQVASRRTVVERFAPVSNGCPEPRTRERVDVLVATDVLAEGVNLQDARHVVSYDLPWNPVRLLQRIGRIDRLGSPHDSICVHLFAPPTALDSQLALGRRLGSKMGQIAGTVGSERPDRLLARVLDSHHGASGGETFLPVEPDHPLEVLRCVHEELLSEAQESQPNVPEPGAWKAGADGRPAVSFLEPATMAMVLVLYRDRPLLLECDDGYHLRPVTLEGARRLAAAAAKPSGDRNAANPMAAEARALTGEVVDRVARHIRQHFTTLLSRGSAPAPLKRTDAAARMARVLGRKLQGAGVADRSTLRRADRLLALLAQPLTPPAAAGASAILRQPKLTVLELLARLEDLLGDEIDTADQRRDHDPLRGGEVRVVAVLLDPTRLRQSAVDDGCSAD